MDCGGVFVKYVLFIFNILFVVCGILIIVFGSILVSHISDVGSVTQTFETNSVPITILVLGCVIFIISFLGCCGAIRENTCFTMTYSVFVLVLFVAQIALIILVWTQGGKFLNYMDQVIAKVWQQHKQDPEVMNGLQSTAPLIDDIGDSYVHGYRYGYRTRVMEESLQLKEDAFNCCGQNGSTDYTFNLEPIPNSCCGSGATSCNMVEAMKKPGCAQTFNSFWKKSINITIYAGLGVAAVELVAFIFACCLANQMRNTMRRANY